METIYAQALWKMIAGGDGRTGKTPRAAVAALRDLLAAKGKSTLLSSIGRAFVRHAEREMRKDEMTLVVAREKDERKAKRDAKAVLENLNMGSDGLKTHIDDTLIGGWRLEGRGVLVDMSYKKQLLDIYNRATS